MTERKPRSPAPAAEDDGARPPPLSERDERWQTYKANGKTIGGAVILALLIRIALFEAFEIEGPSMMPTLLNGDRVVVAKFEYGIFPLFAGKFPVLGSVPLLGGDEAIVNWGIPDAGDVVIVHSPADNVDIVKRVIGVPGDVLEMRDDIVYRNGEPLQVRIAGNCRDDEGRELVQESCEWVEEHIGDETWFTSRDPMQGPDGFEPRTVPPGHIFVMGDHRDHSNDSRNPSVGMIPASRVKGQALAIYWSNEGNGVRWDRLFTAVD